MEVATLTTEQSQSKGDIPKNNGTKPQGKNRRKKKRKGVNKEKTKEIAIEVGSLL